MSTLTLELTQTAQTPMAEAGTDAEAWENQFYAVLSAVRDALSFLSSKKTITPHPHSSAVGRDPDEIALVLGKFGGGLAKLGSNLLTLQRWARTEDRVAELKIQRDLVVDWWQKLINLYESLQTPVDNQAQLLAQHELGLALQNLRPLLQEALSTGIGYPRLGVRDRFRLQNVELPVCVIRPAPRLQTRTRGRRRRPYFGSIGRNLHRL